MENNTDTNVPQKEEAPVNQKELTPPKNGYYHSGGSRTVDFFLGLLGIIFFYVFLASGDLLPYNIVSFISSIFPIIIVVVSVIVCLKDRKYIMIGMLAPILFFLLLLAFAFGACMLGGSGAF